MTIPFKLVHVSAREQLHACLRFKLVHVAENVQQRPLGSHISVGRRIRCNTGPTHVIIRYDQKFEFLAACKRTD